MPLCEFFSFFFFFGVNYYIFLLRINSCVPTIFSSRNVSKLQFYLFDTLKSVNTLFLKHLIYTVFYLEQVNRNGRLKASWRGTRECVCMCARARISEGGKDKNWEKKMLQGIEIILQRGENCTSSPTFLSFPFKDMSVSFTHFYITFKTHGCDSRNKFEYQKFFMHFERE